MWPPTFVACCRYTPHAISGLLSPPALRPVPRVHNSMPERRGSIVEGRTEMNGPDTDADGLFRVYVLRLRSQVWEDSPRCRRENPQYEERRPIVYVGSTGKSIDERLKTHLDGGVYSNTFVHKYFKRKMPSEYRGIRPRQTREAAEARESRKAEELRARGWGVWYG